MSNIADNNNSFGIDINKRWCTTSFSTATLHLSFIDELFFVMSDMFVLIANIIFSTAAIHILKTTKHFRRKRCLWLMYHLYLNDIIFTVVSQALYLFKVVTPGLECIYDLIFWFTSSLLANTSLALIVVVSSLRFMCTKYLVRMQMMLNKRRSWYLLICSFLFGVLITFIGILGASFNSVTLIHLPASISDILVPLVIPIIYGKATAIAKQRRISSYFLERRGETEIILRRGMFVTLAVYLPFRLPFFLISTYKMLYTVHLDYVSNRQLQFTHSACFLIYCMAPVGNSLLYFLSDRRARTRAKILMKNFSNSFLQRVRQCFSKNQIAVVTSRD